MRKPRGKILKVKLGVNPNSSSIGTDVMVMMFGTSTIFILTFVLSSFVRMFRRRKDDAQR